MSHPATANDQVVELHARIAVLEAAATAQARAFAERDADLKRAQGALLLAQAQILELGDLLAARDTALKNAEAGAPDLQRILDTELATANDLRRQLRAAQDAIAAGQLVQAAAHERAAAAERAAMEKINAATRDQESVQATLQATTADLAGHRQHVANLDTIIAELKQKLAAADAALKAETAQHAKLVGERDALAARIAKLQSHWVWRLSGPLHD